MAVEKVEPATDKQAAAGKKADQEANNKADKEAEIKAKEHAAAAEKAACVERERASISECNRHWTEPLKLDVEVERAKIRWANNKVQREVEDRIAAEAAAKIAQQKASIKRAEGEADAAVEAATKIAQQKASIQRAEDGADAAVDKAAKRAAVYAAKLAEFRAMGAKRSGTNFTMIQVPDNDTVMRADRALSEAQDAARAAATDSATNNIAAEARKAEFKDEIETAAAVTVAAAETMAAEVEQAAAIKKADQETSKKADAVARNAEIKAGENAAASETAVGVEKVGQRLLDAETEDYDNGLLHYIQQTGADKIQAWGVAPPKFLKIGNEWGGHVLNMGIFCFFF